MWAGSSAWLERSTDNRKVASSNPARPTISIFQRRSLTKRFTKRKIFQILGVFMSKNSLSKEKILGTNCFNCKFIANNNEPVVSQELNNEGGVNPKNNEEMNRAENSDLITLPGGSKADASSKRMCYNKKIEMYVTVRMCCAYWDNDRVIRPWKKQ